MATQSNSRRATCYKSSKVRWDELDPEARAFAEAGGGFDLDHTRGYWLGGRWVPLPKPSGLKRTTPTLPATAPVRFCVPDESAEEPSQDVGDVTHESMDSDGCTIPMNSADSPALKHFKMGRRLQARPDGAVDEE